MRFTVLLAAIILIAPGALAQTCKTFSSCEEAVRSYKSGNSRLDRDKDGVPCESLCGKNGERMQ
ncbi:excalibur calcium-binding domain protein [Synechococcus sp. PROS-9-1]|uniref:excalibur calcium-binding domain-containing protein n=1 Tax=Synechococcus sp. PROS-9-1 TaxID=1968775 RepID=UPI001644BD8E|nr:excalibur calcium-binding domain protein [Synechococcus sp. PROS-9-1]